MWMIPSILTKRSMSWELANLQLAELKPMTGSWTTRSTGLPDLSLAHARASTVLRELREIRIDLARFSDELSNITKFFGDWHRARIYENIFRRFHLADCIGPSTTNFRTLDNLYQLLNHDQTNAGCSLLEVTIVLCSSSTWCCS